MWEIKLFKNTKWRNFFGSPVGKKKPLIGSGFFFNQIVRLNKFDEAHPEQTRSKKEFGRNPQKDQKPAQNPP